MCACFLLEQVTGIERTPRAMRELRKFAQQSSSFSAFPGSDCGAELHQHPQTSGGSSSTLPCAKRKQAHKCLLSFGAGNGNRTSTSRFARARDVRTARIWLQCIPGKRVRDIASPTPTNFRRVLIHIAMCQKKAGTWAGIERTPRALRELRKFAQRGSGFSAFPVSDCGAGLHLHPQTSGGFSSTLPCAKRKQAHEAPAFFWSR